MDKQALRSEVRARRAARSESDLAGWALLLAAHAEQVPGQTLTAFVGTGGEVPTLPLLDALVAAGRRVLLPITLSDMELDWAEYTGAADLVPAAFGLLEPTGPRLGLDAIAQVDLGRRAHRHQSLHDLAVMATELMSVGERRRQWTLASPKVGVEGSGGTLGTAVLRLPSDDRTWKVLPIPVDERPAAIGVEGYFRAQGFEE